MATVVVSVDAAVLELVVVVVGAAVLAGAGMIVVVVVTCRTSTAGAGCDGGTVSVSCSSSEARNLAIAFRARSGNGPDRVCAQFCSIRASCASIFSTVFIFSSVSANMVGFVYVGVIVVAATAARRSSRLRMFFAAFHQMLSIFLECGKSTEKWADSNRYRHGSGAGVRGALVLWDSGTLMGSDALKRGRICGSGFSVLVRRYSEGRPERLGVKSRTHHHMTQCRGLSGTARSYRRPATTDRTNPNMTKPDNLSTETTKQDQTTATSSESLEPATTLAGLYCCHFGEPEFGSAIMNL